MTSIARQLNKKPGCLVGTRMPLSIIARMCRPVCFWDVVETSSLPMPPKYFFEDIFLVEKVGLLICCKGSHLRKHKTSGKLFSGRVQSLVHNSCGHVIGIYCTLLCCKQHSPSETKYFSVRSSHLTLVTSVIQTLKQFPCVGTGDKQTQQRPLVVLSMISFALKSRCKCKAQKLCCQA